MLSFGVILIWISDPRSLGSWYIKDADESVTRVDSSVPLMYHDPCDLGSLIRVRIAPTERTLNLHKVIEKIVIASRIVTSARTSLYKRHIASGY